MIAENKISLITQKGNISVHYVIEKTDYSYNRVLYRGPKRMTVNPKEEREKTIFLFAPSVQY